MSTADPNAAPMSNKAYIVVGRFNAAHGIKGQIKLESFTQQPDKIFSYPLFLLTEQTYQSITIETKHPTGLKQWIVSLKGITDRNHAEAMVNQSIFIEKSTLDQLAPDEYYWADLIGCSVTNEKQEILGKVTHLVETGANDVLIVKGEKEHWIPYTDDAICNVNIQEKHITVYWEKDF